MKTTPSLVLAGAGLALAAPGHFPSQILKRTGYDVCENDCKLRGAAFPDKHTLQLSLENNFSEQCPPIYIGDANAPTASSRVCLDFVGPNVYFNFEAFPGYSYKDGAVTWQLMGSTPSAPTHTLTCGPSPSGGDGLLCKLPFSDILGVSPASPIKDLLAGMCPNGDREALGLYLQFSGEVASTTDATTTTTTTFNNAPPCIARDTAGVCVSRSTTTPYIGIVYRCSTCAVAACPPEEPEEPEEPPVTTICGLGTAFGYLSAQKSIRLNTQSGQGCNRWGWYHTPTLAELQSGISGPLYVGAGNNDISKATDVGVWVATANASGGVTVTYLLNPPYALAEVHVDLACLPVDKCAPGQYTFGKGGLEGVPTYSTTGVIRYPSCSGGSKAALIVHAAVDVRVQGTVCPGKSD
jgi:hypothetical protein